jgi:hypothetical protein
MNKALIALLAISTILQNATSTSTVDDYAGLVNSNLRELAQRPLSRQRKSFDPTKFLGSSYNNNINSLPLSGQVRVIPWSGDYNAWRYGGISARFGKQDTRWKSYRRSIGMYSQPYDYKKYSLQSNFEQRVGDIYSSAEKYDLLVGDMDFTMTNANKFYGYRVGGRRGDIASWMGMCDGWATASWMFPEPLHPVTVTAADGRTRVKFYVDDIKNLAMIFWRGSKFDNRMVGSRNGAINPASWFVIFANQIGRYGMNMNIEPLADNEIWNFPAKGYSAKITHRSGIGAARSGSPILRQASANSPGSTAQVVHIEMTVYYISETTANPIPKPKKESNARFSFILHCDAGGNILGGVWTSRRRASYIWGPASDVNDPNDPVGSIGGSSSELASLTEAAKKNSKNMMPIKAVVKMLVGRARG